MFVLGMFGLLTPTQQVEAQTSIVQCSGGVGEIALVMDGSGSIDSVQQALRDFGQAFVSAFSVSDTAIRFSVVSFGTTVGQNVGLTGDLGLVRSAIQNFYLGSATNITMGIDPARANLNAGRAGVPRIMVVLTDGGHNESPIIDVQTSANAARGDGITVYAVGYDTGPGNTNPTVLDYIEPGAGTRVYSVSELAQIVGNIVRVVCTTAGGTPVVVGTTCLNLPAGSVVGELTSPTEVFWAPGKISPGVSLQPAPDNKTYWVVGVDESGQYYKIVLSCQFLWVPVGVMAPAYGDPVWNGTPLPTRVVK